MKKSLILLAAIFGILANVEAKPVDVSTAAAAAERFRQAPLSYSLTNGSVRIPRRTAATPYTLTDDSYSAFYVFSNPNGNGFVMIAKDDRLSPIIAYSDNTPWNTENMPDNLKDWLDGYCSMMPYLSGEQSAETAAEWQALFSNIFAPKYPDTPLMETHWGQAPYYNALCPTNEKDGRAVTGCVATAFAQILRYWKYPEHGWGFHAYTDKRYGYLSADFSQHYYDWDHMPVALNKESDSTESKDRHPYCGAVAHARSSFTAQTHSSVLQGLYHWILDVITLFIRKYSTENNEGNLPQKVGCVFYAKSGQSNKFFC